MKLFFLPHAAPRAESHPSRGAWVEIAGVVFVKSGSHVAPLAGCVG